MRILTDWEEREILNQITKAFSTDYIHFIDNWKGIEEFPSKDSSSIYWVRKLTHDKCPLPITLIVFIASHSDVDAYDDDVDVVVYGSIEDDAFYEVHLTWTGERLAVRMYTPFEEVAEASIEVDLRTSGYLEAE